VTIGKIWELAQLDRKVKDGRKYDLVIVDAPATGQGVGFLQTPRTFAGIARVGPISQQAKALDQFICDHSLTGVAIVALPEEMPVNETAILERELGEEIGVSVDRIYLNGLYPERFAATEVERMEDLNGDPGVRVACRAAVRQSRRAQAQREQLARLEEITAAPVTTLPFMFEPEVGAEQITELSRGVD
jgi:anion-transporting  ArsA/GET3 family ATPase